MKTWAYVLLLAVFAASAAAAGTPQGGGKTMGKEAGTPATGVATAELSVLDIFAEGFNDTSLTGFPPAGWLMINADGNVDPEDTCWYLSFTTGGTGSLPPYEGAAFAAAYYGAANGFLLDDWLVTPNTGPQAPAGSVDSLTFWLTSRLSSSGNYPDSLDIRVSTTGTAVGDFTTRLGYVLAPKASWTRFAFALPQGTNRYIAFRYYLTDGGPNGTNSDKVCLDDVRITRYPSTDVAEGPGLPLRPALRQNYPNPFNPSTEIAFDVAELGPVSLRVYDLLGQEVATLVNELKHPGTYTVSFVPDGLASGVYVYRLTAGGATESRRMTLLR